MSSPIASAGQAGTQFPWQRADFAGFLGVLYKGPVFFLFALYSGAHEKTRTKISFADAPSISMARGFAK